MSVPKKTVRPRGPVVRVSDPFESRVTAAEALSYCRRTLVRKRGWSEREVHVGGGVPVAHFEPPEPSESRESPGVDGPEPIAVPTLTEAADFARRMAEACDGLVRAGVVRWPSEALRAMSRRR